MISIGTNIEALILQNTLEKNTIGLNNSIEHMTTGYKLNRAKDDAAGFSIAEKLNSQISSMLMLQQNADTALSVLNTAEGGLQNIMSLLQRLRDLAEQAANSVYGDDSREAMQKEADQIMEQIDVIRSSTKFNGINLFEGPVNGGIITTSNNSNLISNNIVSRLANSVVINNIKNDSNNLDDIFSSSIIPTSISLGMQSGIDTSTFTPVDSSTVVFDTEPSQSFSSPSISPLADIEGAESFAASETRTITIDGISYTITNRQSVSSSLSYMKDTATGEITFIGNYFTIKGQTNVQHNIIINGSNNYVYGGDLDDTIKDTTNNKYNYIYGGAGNDTLIINGGWGAVYGQDGNDTITTNGTYNNISAGEGDDIINAYGNAEKRQTIKGDAGNDIFNIYCYSYIIQGGDGDDTFNLLSGSASNIINGEAGTNTVTGSVGSNVTANVVGANSYIVDFLGNETKVVNINGIDYTVTNSSSNTNSLIYSVNSSGRITFNKLVADRAMTIKGDVNKTHNVLLSSMYLTFYGGNYNDTITLGYHSQSVYGGDGDDTITISNGAAYYKVYGQGGNDTITTNGTRGFIVSGDGDDIVTVNDQANYVDTGDGNNTVSLGTSAKNCSIIGGSGSNTLNNNSLYNLINGFGSYDNSDIFTVGAGATQTVTINGKTYTIKNNLSTANSLLYSYNAVSDRTTLSAFHMNVTAQSNVSHNLDLYGYNTYFYGGNLADDINAYTYQSNIYGLSGNDNIINRGPLNNISAGDGDDTIIMNSGGYVSGGNGNDTITINANCLPYTIAGGAGDDTYNINAACTPTDTGGNNTYNINANNVTVTGSSGNDTFYVKGNNNTVSGAGGDDYFVIDSTNYNFIDGGTGNNFYVDNSNGNAVIINATNDANSGVLNFTYVGEVKTFTVDGKTYTVKNETTLATSQATNQLRYTYNTITGQITTYGSNFTITSDDSSCNLGVRGDNNIINGSKYDDKITVESGTNNQINGLEGNDNLISNTENNSLNGGAGNDTININASTNKEITGGDGDDIININSDDNTNINTGSGNDRVTGTGNNNVVNVSDGDNNVLITGDGNKIIANDGNNKISAVGDNNSITSGNGNNIIGVDGTSNTVNDGSGNSDYNIYGESNVFNVTGGDNDVTIEGNSNRYNGGSGVDDVTIRGDGNTANGGDSNDTFVVRSGNNNFIDGNAGNMNTLLDRGNNTTYQNVILLGQNPFQATFKVDLGTTANDYINITIECPYIAFNVDLSSSSSASDVLEDIDDMINQINEQLANIGATMNRLESVRTYQTIKMNNMISTLSTIKDTDIAKESSNFIRFQILQNASVSLLSLTRNLRSDNVLTLLNSVNIN